MKILSGLVIIGFTVIFISSCKKESKIPVESSATITGKWELRRIVGNFTKNFPPGNGTVVEFTSSSFSTVSPKDNIFLQGIAPSQGTYKIVPDLTVNTCTGLGFPFGQFAYRLILNDNETADKLFFQLEGDKLIVIFGYFPTDGGLEKIYQKQ